MKVITVTSLIVALVALVVAVIACTLAYFNYLSTQEYFGYFEAEKALVAFLGLPAEEKKTKAENTTDDVQWGELTPYYKLLGSDTFLNTSEFFLQFTNGSQYRFVLGKDGSSWKISVYKKKSPNHSLQADRANSSVGFSVLSSGGQRSTTGQPGR
jgi:hypothetical protein